MKPVKLVLSVDAVKVLLRASEKMIEDHPKLLSTHGLETLRGTVEVLRSSLPKLCMYCDEPVRNGGHDWTQDGVTTYAHDKCYRADVAS